MAQSANADGARGGRGRGGSGRGEGRGQGRSRGKGRGRGGRGGNAAAGVALDLPAAAQPPPQPGGAGSLGARLTKTALNDSQGEKAELDAADDQAEVCFICANEPVHFATAPCGHTTCHICSLRLRALYKTKACATCRTEATDVIFSDDAEKSYADHTRSEFLKKDDNLGISYQTVSQYEDTLLLLRYNCPDENCDVACMGWPDLHRHVKSAHHKMMCDLCTRNKKVFTHEHVLFTQQELRRHEKQGDDNPGAIDQTGFKGHPECGFCRQRFFGEDELYTHCREKHERCHVCDQRTGGNNPQYFMDYNALEQHFGRDHFPCMDSECQEKKFVVFGSEMDLKAHQLESHPNGLSKDARRDARRVDLSSFDYRPQYQETPARRGGRRAGRGRDPNSEPMPAASGGHMSRAELAHQREREIQSAQTVTSRTFGGQLSRPEPQTQTAHRPVRTESPRPANAQPATATAEHAARAVESLTPQEQARRLRHAAVTERASNLLRNDQTKIGEFRERVSSYRNGVLSPADLIDAFFSLFDTSSAELGKLIKELADIFELPGKRDALLRAWSDWKAINEDYPSLPGPTGDNATSAAGILGAGVGTNRVLKLKSSTAKSSRSAMGQQRSWGTAGASSSSAPKNAFPSLPAAGNGGTPRGGSTPAPGPNWLAVRPAASASASSSNRPSPAPSRTNSSANINKSANAFPALPPGKKPTSTVFSPGYSGSGVLRPTPSGTPANAWGGSSGNASGAQSPAAVEEGETGGKGKGKKGKKQVLFNWG